MSQLGNGMVTAGGSRKRKDEGPVCSNRVLAGYLAHEFLTKGTVLGQRFDPARGEAVPVPVKKWKESYAEVASMLKTDGAHIPGVVNPTQLARWINR